MDPITAFAAVTAIWGGIKKTVELGREVQDVWGQLSKWAQAADIVEQHATDKPKKPSIFGKLDFSNDTKDAFDAYTAKVKLREMEAEIRHQFLYGALCHLGLDGYREFIQIRRGIRERRVRAIQEQAIRRRELVEHMFIGGLILAGAAAAVSILWMAVELISMGHAQ